jgi:hypothetical protein
MEHYCGKLMGPYTPTERTDAAAPAQSSYTFKRASWEEADVICNDPQLKYGTAAVVLLSGQHRLGRKIAANTL